MVTPHRHRVSQETGHAPPALAAGRLCQPPRCAGDQPPVPRLRVSGAGVCPHSLHRTMRGRRSFMMILKYLQNTLVNISLFACPLFYLSKALWWSYNRKVIRLSNLEPSDHRSVQCDSGFCHSVSVGNSSYIRVTRNCYNKAVSPREYWRVYVIYFTPDIYLDVVLNF